MMNSTKSRHGGKALIVSPYLDHVGGGERYMLSAAKVLQDVGYEITIGWDNLDSIFRICQMLDIHLKDPQLDQSFMSLYQSRNPLAMFRATRLYDVVVYLSDGSVPALGGRCNIVHLQVPFHGVGGRGWKNQLKKHTINDFIVNSNFTKRVVDQEYGINSKVIYPPVQSIVTGSVTKDKLILSVGRFESSLNIKRQDVLIDAFVGLNSKLPDWRLVLVGGSSSDEWVESLRSKIGVANIEIKSNVTHNELVDLYRRASIYWHAAGYGVDVANNPELTEHFGISTVEAISARAIPLVVGSGGQTEIVSSPDLTWQSIDELQQKTIILSTRSFADYESGFDTTRYSYQSFADNLKGLLI